MVNCWAEKLGNCSKKQSREHLISKGIFESDGTQEPYMVVPWGLNWCKDNPKTVSLASLTSKILCEYHNNLLSPVDSEAIRAYNIFRNIWSSNFGSEIKPETKNIVYQINGNLLERWFLKTAINVLYSDWGLDKPPIELIEIAFGIKKFPQNVGLCISTSLKYPKVNYEDGIKITPLMIDYKKFTTILFEFKGWKFALPLISNPLPPTLNHIRHIPFSYLPVDNFINEFLNSRLIFHPRQFDFEMINETCVSVKFNWELPNSIEHYDYACLDGWISSKKIMFYTMPIAIDSNGKRVFCKVELNKQKGKYIITVPNDFLNNAKYPVKIKGGFYPSREAAINFYNKKA